MFDALFFTVFPDPGPNKNEDYVEPEFAEILYPDYMESADPENPQSLLAFTRPRTPPYLPRDVGSRNNTGPQWIQLQADPTGIQDDYRGFFEESFHTHSVTSLQSVNIDKVRGPDKAREFGWADRDMIHSGWAPRNKPPRIGYSVKFISMDALVKSLVVKSTSGGQTRIANPPTGDPDLDQILH